MKILHTADWHLGRELNERDRHLEQEAVLDEICRIADDENVQAVLIAGDVFDTYNPPAQSEELFYRTTTRLSRSGRRAVIVIAGNHDSPSRLLASNPYASALGISIIGNPKDPPSLYDNGNGLVACVHADSSLIRLRIPGHDMPLTVLALPYPSEGRMRTLFTADNSDDAAVASDYNRRVKEFMEQTARGFLPGGLNIVASHLFVTGGTESESERRIQVGGASSVDTMSFPDGAAYVALGHLHRPQEQHGPRDVPVRYSGSVLQYSFSEAGQEKSVTILESDATGKITYRVVPLTSGRTLHNWKMTSMEELERALRQADHDSWIRFDLSLQEAIPDDYMQNLRRQHPNVIDPRVHFISDQESEAQQIRISELTREEQFRLFTERQYGEPASEEVVRLFLEIAEGDGE